MNLAGCARSPSGVCSLFVTAICSGRSSASTSHARSPARAEGWSSWPRPRRRHVHRCR